MGIAPSERDFEGARRGACGDASAYRLSFLVLLLGFSALTFAATSTGSPSDLADRPRVLTTLLTVTGPFTGAIARGGQSCCLEFSTWLAMWLAPAPVVALGSRLLLGGRGGAAGAVGVALWTLGRFVWLAGGIVSFGHAFG
ncbi:MAG: hypothetical protein BGO49_21855 [Planctomycetales bacterium 71-10]|nr:MAG: hypothetical protein BGO49_21855 [Planctomycetales bacterium 71-10]